jgi:hypothetical protein
VNTSHGNSINEAMATKLVLVLRLRWATVFVNLTDLRKEGKRIAPFTDFQRTLHGQTDDHIS